ncbi:toll/interleukin-1 receptor domain-containing protein [Actinosynnema sp. NPDC059335]|uniref:toll/interleukin-1 receptor domain-containing protein n=1 Tax=Actinosynnema sp. NPDC059335 TaxID=3346804 RepID=UPI00366F2511
MTRTRPVVLISHSTSGHGPDGRPTLAGRVKEELYALLGRDYAWLDSEDLRGGDRWEEQLSVALMECSAVVLLIDRHALRSKWVQRESWVANTRRQAGANLTAVVPIVFPGVSREEALEVFAEIRDLHFLRPPRDDRAAARWIVDKVEQALAVPAPRHPAEADYWVELVAGHLGHLRGEHLTSAVTALELTEAQRRQVIGQRDAHRVLASFLVTRSSGSHLVAAMPWLRIGMERSRREELVDYLRPTWVDEKQAVQLLAVAGGRPRRVELGAADEWVGLDYARRAVQFRHDHRVDRPPEYAYSEAAEDEFLLALKRALDRRARSAAAPLRLDGRVRRVLVALIRDLPLHTARNAVRRLHDDHPEVTVLLLTGDRVGTPDDDAVVLRPLSQEETGEAQRFIEDLARAADVPDPFRGKD